MALTKKQLDFKETIIAKLKEEQNGYDNESEHINADALLCELLTELGCKDVVKEFKKIGKWYA